jgi:hypothetical protein
MTEDEARKRARCDWGHLGEPVVGHDPVYGHCVGFQFPGAYEPTIMGSGASWWDAFVNAGERRHNAWQRRALEGKLLTWEARGSTPRVRLAEVNTLVETLKSTKRRLWASGGDADDKTRQIACSLINDIRRLFLGEREP